MEPRGGKLGNGGGPISGPHFLRKGKNMKEWLWIQQVECLNVFTRRFQRRDVGIVDNRILAVEEPQESRKGHCIDGRGKYLVPGLIDIHMHIESSMAAPIPFAQALLPCGVTTIVAEPHEIANIFGTEGIMSMIELGRQTPIDILLGIPSSVPSTQKEYETTGAEIGVEEVEELLKLPEAACLGEVMNYYDVINVPNAKIHQILSFFKEKAPKLPIEGHCPQIRGEELSQFVAAGIDSDHTLQTVAGMRERIEKGMLVQVQEKSIHPELMEAIVKEGLDSRVALVTDDVMPDHLMADGHLDHVVRKAIEAGLPPEIAIVCATYVPAVRMKLDDRGAIAPGKKADFILLSNLENFEIEATYKNGRCEYKKNQKQELAKMEKSFPPHFYQSIKLDPFCESQFEISKEEAFVNGESQGCQIGWNPSVSCRVMMVQSDSTFTKEERLEVPVKNGKLDWEQTEAGMIAVIERHGIHGKMGKGLIAGATIKRGAVATTYAHDHHNLLVVGHTREEMAMAANRVIELQGGIAVVENGEILAELPLPVAGILSEEPVSVIGEQMGTVRQALEKLGYQHYDPIMSLCTNSLPVSQLLKITDQGLIKLSENRLVSLAWEE